jgi:cytochrome c
MGKILFTVALLGFLLIGGAEAADHGTRDEAMALVGKSIDLISAEGQAAFSKFNDKQGAFVDRDLYVAVFDPTGTILAHGANAALIGVNLADAKDPDGKPFAKEILKAGKEHPEGSWVDFKFTNPITKKIEPKSMFVRSVGTYTVGVGVYGG